MAREAPKGVPGTRKTRLHFIGNKNPAVCVHHVDGLLQKAARVRQHAVR